MKAGEHGPDELYDKFRVFKAKKMISRESWNDIQEFHDDDELTHKEFVFVLRPETEDVAAIAALRTYAQYCAPTYPGLARDIYERLNKLGLA